MGNDEINQIGNVFTYFMTLFSFLLIGEIFLLVNGRLLIVILNGTFPDFTAVINEYIIQYWKAFFEKNLGGTFSILFLSMVLVMGMILKSFSNIFIIIGYKLGHILSKNLVYQNMKNSLNCSIQWNLGQNFI